MALVISHRVVGGVGSGIREPVLRLREIFLLKGSVNTAHTSLSRTRGPSSRGKFSSGLGAF